MIRIDIQNDGTGTQTTGNYDVTIYYPGGRVKKIRIEDHPRVDLLPEFLLKIIKQLKMEQYQELKQLKQVTDGEDTSKSEICKF